MAEKTEQERVAEFPKPATLSETFKESKIISKENKRKKSAGRPPKTKISVCDVMKSNTSRLTKKLESQIPSNIQLYSDLYSEYLHMYDDLFGTCYATEKQFFEKIGIDNNILGTLDDYSNVLTNFYSSQIDIASNYLKMYIQLRVSAIKSYDRYMHVLMDSYAKMFSQFNSIVKN